MTTTATPITGHPDYELITSYPDHVRNVRHHGDIVGRVRYHDDLDTYWAAEMIGTLREFGHYETAEQAAAAVAVAHQIGQPEFLRRHMWAEDVTFRGHLPGWVPPLTDAQHAAAVAARDVRQATGVRRTR